MSNWITKFKEFLTFKEVDQNIEYLELMKETMQDYTLSFTLYTPFRSEEFVSPISFYNEEEDFKSAVIAKINKRIEELKKGENLK